MTRGKNEMPTYLRPGDEITVTKRHGYLKAEGRIFTVVAVTEDCWVRALDPEGMHRIFRLEHVRPRSA